MKTIRLQRLLTILVLLCLLGQPATVWAGLAQDQEAISPAAPTAWEADRDAYFLNKLSGKEPARDSASAATAISTGFKTDDGNLAWLPGDPVDGSLTTIAESLRTDHGFAIGVASTVQFSHATPAGFVSHNVNRNNYEAIANEIINTFQPEVVIGGGHPIYYSPTPNYAFVGGTSTWDNLLGGTSGYTHVVQRQDKVDGGDELLASAADVDLNAGDKLVGVFGGPGGNFDYHAASDTPGAPSITLGTSENPSLSDVVTATLGVLSQDDDGLFVMFEQGDIDWSNHNNHYENMVGGVWDLNQAVQSAEDFIDQPGGPEWDDTLVIVTSDHSNSYMRLPYPLGNGDLPEQTWVDLNGNGAVNDGEWYYPNGEATYRSYNHTNELVRVYAHGEGSSLFDSYAGSWYTGTQIIDNSQFYAIMNQAVDDGVKHVILFIGDGMNVEHEIAASRYLYGEDFGLVWNAWGDLVDGYAGVAATWDVTTYNKYATAAAQPAWATTVTPVSLGSNNSFIGYDPAKGGALPYPLDVLEMDPYYLTLLNMKEPATDSGSAATAISTGYKTDDGNIAWKPGDPPDGKLTTIAEALRTQFGFAIGVASTVQFSHATPAGFVSHNVNRNNYDAIANEIIYTVKPEVVIGGGHPFFFSTPANYSYVGGQATWTELNLGLTSYSDLVVRQAGLTGRITLQNKANQVNLAMGDRLMGVFGGAGGNFEYNIPSDSPGAPLVVQGSSENPTLGDMTTNSLKVLSQDPDGFFVMFEQGDIDWANHENNFKNMIGGVWDLDLAVKAAETFVDQAGGPSWNDTLVIVTSDHSNSYMRLNSWLGKGDLPAQIGNSSNWTYPNGEVSYSTKNHTNEMVTLAARGQGATLFQQYVNTWLAGTQIIDNSQIYEVMRRAVNEQGVRHVILFIGDGMNIEHEIAASRYLYGVDMGLAWHDWRTMQTGWGGYVATWDVTTYNKYAAANSQPAWQIPPAPVSLGLNNVLNGYDPVKGGAAPFPLQPGYGGMNTTPGYLSMELDPGGASTASLALPKTGNINVMWSASESVDAPWLTVTPATTGYLIYDSTVNLSVNFNATGLEPGHYRTELIINTPYHKFDVPVLLKVKASGVAPQSMAPFTLAYRGSYNTGINTAAEISAYDPDTATLYVTNGYSQTLDILSLATLPPTFVEAIDLTPYGGGVSSVDVYDGLVAVALPAIPVQDRGDVLFIQGDQKVTVQVGSLPDMVTFTPDGSKLLVANEGEPSSDYTVDPEGTISVIDVSGGFGSIDQSKVAELNFNDFDDAELDPMIRIFGKNASVSQDFEPEYITVLPDGLTAWATLQENNALAKIDLSAVEITEVLSLGFKDWSGSEGFDASDKDGKTVSITNYPVKGLYLPDGITSFTVGGTPYLLTANEGDSRAYSALNEEFRIKDIVLDPFVFPNGALLRADPVLGRLKITTAGSNFGSPWVADPDHDGMVENLFAYGGRSISIWNGMTGALVWDSGDDIERITAVQTPLLFNTNDGDPAKTDDRSDDKGPEPEGVVVGEIMGKDYAFVNLERAGGGMMVYEVSNPAAPIFVMYVPNADGDISPEGILFIPGYQSPTHNPLLVLTNELSGSTAVFEVIPSVYLPLVNQ